MSHYMASMHDSDKNLRDHFAKWDILDFCKKIEYDMNTAAEQQDSLQKNVVIGALAKFLKLQGFVAVGLGHPSTFLSCALSIKSNGGRSYGFDPRFPFDFFSPQCFDAFQNATNPLEKNRIDYPEEYIALCGFINRYGLSTNTFIIGKQTPKPLDYFVAHSIKPDILLYDGQSFPADLAKDFQECISCLRPYGILIFDHIDQEEAKRFYDSKKDEMVLLFETDCLGILLNAPQNQETVSFANTLNRQLSLLYATPAAYHQIQKNQLTIFEHCNLLSSATNANLVQLAKHMVCAFVAQTQQIKKYVDVGLAESDVFDAVAYSVACNKGKSCGITLCDPTEDNLPEGSILQQYLFQQYKLTMLNSSARRVCLPAYQAYSEIEEMSSKPQFISIQIHPITPELETTCDLLQMMANKGTYFLFNGINTNEKDQVDELIHCDMIPVFKADTFCIYMKGVYNTENQSSAETLSKKLDSLYQYIISGNHQQQLSKYYNKVSSDCRIKMTVAVITYNHGPFICDCLSSIINQSGNFSLHVIVCDDCSTDDTRAKILDFVEKHPQNDRLTWELSLQSSNLGILLNVKNVLSRTLASNCDFFSIIDGDDKYTDLHRIALNIENLLKNPQCTLSSNIAFIENVADHTITKSTMQFNRKYATMKDLIKENMVGSSCVSLMSSRAIKAFDFSAFEKVPLVTDWFMDMCAAQIGDISILRLPLTVYRRRLDSCWSGLEINTKYQQMRDGVLRFNRFFNYRFDQEFEEALCSLDSNRSSIPTSDIIVIDSIFPAAESGFRFSEYCGLLQRVDNLSIYCTGDDYYALPGSTLTDRIQEFKQKHPNWSDRIRVFNPQTPPPLKGKLLYGVFLSLAYHYLMPQAEKWQIPFAFTLYPGGGFNRNNETSDAYLRAVCNSPWFRKVIVTQKTTYDYLLQNNFCRKDQIFFLYGGMTVAENMNRSLTGKRYYHENKSTLDICFVAQRYSPNGHEKGYDIFIDAAKILSAKYPFARFHVVGNWNHAVLDTTGITDIHFHGVLQPSSFHAFYQEMDILISPNPKRTDGTFDGFPTTCAVDAMLHGVASFVSDPLQLNQGYFAENEIAIISTDAQEIVDKIIDYVEHPESIKKLAFQEYTACNRLLDHEAQITPRAQLLLDLIKQETESKIVSTQTTASKAKTSLLQKTINAAKWCYHQLLPPMLQPVFRKLLKNMGGLYRKLVPEIFKRIYQKAKKSMGISWNFTR